jgi:phage shock protein E
LKWGVLYAKAEKMEKGLQPVNEIASKAEEKLPDKDAKILVYCRSGNRSAKAAKQLIKMGYTNVYDFGGINSWPYGTVK